MNKMNASDKQFVDDLAKGFRIIEMSGTLVQIVKMTKVQYEILDKLHEIDNKKLWGAKIEICERNLNPVMINKRKNMKVVFNGYLNTWYLTKRS
jgi:hypothetical protein